MRALWALVLIGILMLVTNKLDQTVETGLQDARKSGVTVTEEGLKRASNWAKKEGPAIAAEAQARYDKDVSPLITDLVSESTNNMNKQ